MSEREGFKVTAVIPAFKAVDSIQRVIRGIPAVVGSIIVVDDACPRSTGAEAEKSGDSRVEVLYHEKNKGVGGAMVTGYQLALQRGDDIVVKIDADGQMDASKIQALISPIVSRRADYAKGNRFDDIASLKQMPLLRLMGNAILSLLTKFSSGYWSVNDPTNGFTAVHRSVLAKIQIDKLSNRFFFESDMLYRLSTIRAVVSDVPMPAIYGDEKSNLSVFRAAVEFPFLHLRNLIKRITLKYFLREWSVASLELILGLSLLVFSFVFGLSSFMDAIEQGSAVTAGQAVIFAVALIVGFQLFLSVINYDVESEPSNPRQLDLEGS